MILKNKDFFRNLNIGRIEMGHILLREIWKKTTAPIIDNFHSYKTTCSRYPDYNRHIFRIVLNLSS